MCGDRSVAVQTDARSLPQVLVAEQQVVRIAVGEEGRERDAVVRRTRLLAEDLDVPALGGPTRVERLDQPLGDHAGADDDQLLLCCLTHDTDGRFGRFHDRDAPVSEP